MRTRTTPVFTATGVTPDPSGKTSSVAIDAQYAMRASAIVVLSGASGNPAGVLSLQASNAIPPSGTGASGNFAPPANSWVDLATTTVSTNGTYTTPPTELCSRWVRVSYRPSAGSGGQLDGNIHIIGWP